MTETLWLGRINLIFLLKSVDWKFFYYFCDN